MFKVLSLFSGVGGIDLPFEKFGFKIIYANDFDSYAVQTYNENFQVKATLADITKVDVKDLPQHDVLIGGFPCQPFSIAGYRKGFDDTRGTLFFNVANILKEKKPSVIMLENVKNLVSHDNGNTFEVILNTLKELGYHIKYSVLNACEYGNMPQNRERIYIVAFRNKEDYDKFQMPMSVALSNTIKDVFEFDKKVDDKYYYTMGKYKGEMCELLEKEMDDDNTVYQWRRKYVRKNQSNLVPTLTANMGEGRT